MGISFKIYPTKNLQSGLNYQVVYAKGKIVKSWSELNENDFQGSIAINIKAFDLVFANFFQHQDPNRSEELRWGYAYGVNFHDKNSIKNIIKEISQLKQQLEIGKVPLTQLGFYYPRQLQKLFTIKRISYKKQPIILFFLTEILAFLQKVIDNEDIMGIYFLGI